MWYYLFEKSLFFPMLDRLKSGEFSETTAGTDNLNVSNEANREQSDQIFKWIIVIKTGMLS